VELTCLAIVTLYIAARGRLDGWSSWPLEFATTAVAAWACEQSCISGYGFYHYNSVEWTVTIGHVPLAVALIWPVVILSARQVAASMFDKQALATALIVLFDAALIEPLAVAAGLWRWTEPGLFGVPPIGVVGWAAFTFLWSCSANKPVAARALVTFVGLHAVLLVLWWGGLRWISADVAPTGAIITLAIASLGGCLWAAGHAAARGFELRRAMLRVPGALFFAVLFATSVRTWMLGVWTFLIALPWLVAVATAWHLARSDTATRSV
jgi:hypothetical protein